MKNKRYYWLGGVIAIVICIASLFCVVFPVFNFGSTKAFSGSGTAADPYIVSDANDLKLFQTQVNNGNNFAGQIIKQLGHIDMEGVTDFVGIGLTATNHFAGTYDGQSYSIRNLYIGKEQHTDLYTGLFGYIKGATIKNVVLENANFSHTGKNGALGATGATNANGGAGGAGANDIYVGGIAGYSINSEISGCHFDGSIYGQAASGNSGGRGGARNSNGTGTNGGAGGAGKMANVGGVVGRAVDTLLSLNSAAGHITSCGGSGGGGGAGYSSYGTGTTGGVGGAGGAGGDVYTGGIVGHLSGTSTLERSYTSIEMIARPGTGGGGGGGGAGSTTGGKGGNGGNAGQMYAGGVAGYSAVNITNCFSMGRAELEPRYKGFVGAGAKINGKTNGANGSAPSVVYPLNCFGGIVGYINTANVKVEKCYSTMNVDEGHDFYRYDAFFVRISGIVGYINADNVAIVDCISLNESITAENISISSATHRRLIAAFATYETATQQALSIMASSGNKRYRDEDVSWAPMSGDAAILTYGASTYDSFSGSYVDTNMLLLNKPGVFSAFSNSVWDINTAKNNGMPAIKALQWRTFDYNKKIQINSYADLKAVSDRCNKGYNYYGQTLYINNDIVMDSNTAWEPIGSDFLRRFQGSVEGQNKKVSKITIAKSTNYKGLFGYVSTCKIVNLTIEDPVFTSNSGDYAGAFFGYSLHDGYFENLHTTQGASAYGNTAIIKGNRYCGGIGGYLFGMFNTFRNCGNNVNVTSTVTNYNESSNGNAGGLLGYMRRVKVFENNYNTGNITVNSPSTTQIYYYAGGLVGGMDGVGCLIRNCFNTGNISASGRAGGLVGYHGTLGYGYVIENCYSTGDLAHTYGSTTAFDAYNGGLVALAYYNLTMRNCVNACNKLTIGGTTNSIFAGRLVTFGGAPISISSNYYYTRDTFVSSNNYYNSNQTWPTSKTNDATYKAHAWFYETATGRTAKTLAEIKATGFFEASCGWDFTNIWQQDSNVNDGFPTLKSNFNNKAGIGDNPMLISSKADLENLRNMVNGGNKFAGLTFLQTQDIDLGGENWAPIGSSSTIYFSGYYDGGGHKITGLYIDKATDFKGLFGYAINAQFKNLTIENPNFMPRAGQYTGSVLGYGTTSIKFDNVHVKGGQVANLNTDYVGGIFGYVGNGATVTGCSTENVDVHGKTYIGGLAGMINGTTAHTGSVVDMCWNASHVYGTGGAVGGIVGSMRGGTVKNSYNTGSISAYAGYVGGLVGYGETVASTFTNLLNLGNIYSYHSTSSVIAGGIIGYIGIGSCVANYCISDGEIRAVTIFSNTGSYVSNAGGIVGHCNIATAITINNCAVASDIVAGYGPAISYTGSDPMGCGYTTARPSGGGTAGSSNNFYYNKLELGARKTVTQAQLTTVVSDAKSKAAFYNVQTYQNAGWSAAKISESNTAEWKIESGEEELPYIRELGKPVFPLGSEENPYEINDKQDLINLSTRVQTGDRCAGQYFKLTNSFDVGIWETPIGTSATLMFGGIFDGDLHTLRNLSSPAGRVNGYYGLFGYTAMATIKNLIVSNINISISGAPATGDYIAPIIARSDYQLTVDNCAVTSGKMTTYGLYIGGMIGGVYHDGNKVTRCYSAVEVMGGGKTGGFIGVFSGGTIDRCYATGNVTAVDQANYHAGGLVGLVQTYSSYITNCYARGNVQDVTVTADYAMAGALVGQINTTRADIINCYAIGTATASVSKSITTSGTGAYASGLVGCSNAASSNVNINYCVSLSQRVSATAPSANTTQSTKIVGCTVTTSTNLAKGISNYYLDTAVYGANKGIGGAAITNAWASTKTDEDLHKYETYVNLGWNIYDADNNTDGLWNLRSTVNDGLPHLLGLVPNLADLEKLMSQAESYTQTDWSIESWEVLTNAYNNAKEIQKQQNPSAESIEVAIEELANAIKDLRGDISKLKELYDQFCRAHDYLISGGDRISNENLAAALFNEYGSWMLNIDLQVAYQNWTLAGNILDAVKKIIYPSATEDGNYSNSYIDNAFNVLNSAIQGLLVSKTELNIVITDANRLRAENYAVADWYTFSGIRTEAININNDSNATAKEVYTAKELLSQAMKNLKPDFRGLDALIEEIDKTIIHGEYKIVVTTNQADYEAALEEYASTEDTNVVLDLTGEYNKRLSASDFTVNSWNDFITAFRKVIDLVGGDSDVDDEKMLETIANCSFALQEAMYELTLNRTSLQSLVNWANTIDIKHFYAESWNTKYGWNEFRIALQLAQAELSKSRAIFDELKTAKQSLIQKYDALNDAIEKYCVFAELQANFAIAVYEIELYEDAIENEEYEIYTLESWQRLLDAVNGANKILEDLENGVRAAFTKVDESTEELILSIQKLEVNMEYLKALLLEADVITKGYYIDESFAQLQEYIEIATIVFDLVDVYNDEDSENYNNTSAVQSAIKEYFESAENHSANTKKYFENVHMLSVIEIVRLAMVGLRESVSSLTVDSQILFDLIANVKNVSSLVGLNELKQPVLNEYYNPSNYVELSYSPTSYAYLVSVAEEGWNMLIDIYSVNPTLLDEQHYTLAQINEKIVDKIQKFLAATKSLEANKSELLDRINAISSMSNERYRQNSLGQWIMDPNNPTELKVFIIYTADSWAALQSELIEARKVYLMPTSNPATVQTALDALNAKFKALVPDVTELEEKIVYANELLAEAKKTNKWLASSVKSLENACTDVEEALTKHLEVLEKYLAGEILEEGEKLLSLTELQNYLDELNNAIAGLQVDTDILLDLLAEALIIKTNEDYIVNLISSGGDADRKYTAGSYSSFVATYNYVKSLESSFGTLTFENIITLYISLKSAIDGLKPNKEPIIREVNRAKAFDPVHITDESYKNLAKAIMDAESVIANADATLNDVDPMNPESAYNKLQNAIYFIEINPAEIQIIITEAKEKLLLKYTEDSKKPLLDKITEVESKLVFIGANLAYTTFSNVKEVMDDAAALKDLMTALVVDKEDLAILIYGPVVNLDDGTREGGLIDKLTKLTEEGRAASSYYTADSIDKLNELLALAENMLKNTVKPSLQEVANLISAINATYDGLVIDKTELDALIIHAEKILITIDTYYQQTGNVYYEQNGIDVLEDATADAISLSEAIEKFAKAIESGDNYLIQITINEYIEVINALESAVGGLIFRADALEDLMIAAQYYLDNKTDYSSGSIGALEDAIAWAEEYDPEEDADGSLYISLCMNIDEKIQELVYIRTLSEKVAAAYDKLSIDGEFLPDNNTDANAAELLGVYLSHYIKLKNAYLQGVTALKDPYVYQITVDNIIVELSYEDYMTDISALSISFAVAITKDASLYSASSYAVLRTAMNTAELILAESASVQSDIDDATAALNSAIGGLVAIPFTNMLIDLYNTVKDFKEEDYTAASWAAFSIYRAQAYAVINNPEASQSTAMNVYNLLSSAIDNLIDISELRDLYKEYLKIESQYYTLTTASVFNAEMVSTNTLLTNAKDTNKNITKKQIQDQITALNNARFNLVIDASALEALYNRVQFYDASQFVPDSIENDFAFASFAVKRTNALNAIMFGTSESKLTAFYELNAAVTALKVNTDAAQAIISYTNLLNSLDWASGYAALKAKVDIVDQMIKTGDYMSFESYQALVSELTALKNALQYNDSELRELINHAEIILLGWTDFSNSTIATLYNRLVSAKAFVPGVSGYDTLCTNLKNSIDDVINMMRTEASTLMTEYAGIAYSYGETCYESGYVEYVTAANNLNTQVIAKLNASPEYSQKVTMADFTTYMNAVKNAKKALVPNSKSELQKLINKFNYYNQKGLYHDASVFAAFENNYLKKAQKLIDENALIDTQGLITNNAKLTVQYIQNLIDLITAQEALLDRDPYNDASIQIDEDNSTANSIFKFLFDINDVITDKSDLQYGVDYGEVVGKPLYLTNIAPRQSLSLILAQFENSTVIEVYDKDDLLIPLANYSSNICTGWKLRIVESGAIVDEVILVVLGDVRGAGVVNTSDINALYRHITGVELLTGAYKLAAYVNANTNITTSNINTIYRYITGTDEFAAIRL